MLWRISIRVPSSTGLLSWHVVVFAFHMLLGSVAVGKLASRPTQATMTKNSGVDIFRWNRTFTWALLNQRRHCHCYCFASSTILSCHCTTYMESCDYETTMPSSKQISSPQHAHYIANTPLSPDSSADDIVTTIVTVPITVSGSISDPPYPSFSAILPSFGSYAPSSSDIDTSTSCSSLAAYRYVVAVLSSVIGITLLLALVVFCYVKPKKWKKQGKAEAEGQNGEELKELKRDRDEWKGRYELLRTLPR